jgi:hypothetical protein
MLGVPIEGACSERSLTDLYSREAQLHKSG